MKALVFSVSFCVFSLFFSSQLFSKSTFKSNSYIVELASPAVPMYKGGIDKLAPTNPAKNGSNRFDPRAKAVLAYKNHLKSEQMAFLQQAKALLKREIKPKHEYFFALNGMAIEVTRAEAARLAKLSGVKSVSRDYLMYKQTDRGPGMIGADQVWSGTFNSTEARGEGVVVGIIDTGIHHDHPSFSGTVDADGYVHTNPLGSNNYLGQCVSQPSLCNSKLIGSYNFVEGNSNPEDEDGHGTHVASTAAGNLLQFDIGNGETYDLSGVAPRANIISYKISDASGTSTGSATIAAIEQAIEDGVDIINFSFGFSGDLSPWEFSIGTSYLAARDAGIAVFTSAGNSGPDAATMSLPANAPWLTSVAATTHDRGNYPTKRLTSMSGGVLPPPSEITGRSMSGSISAAIVYAGNFDNGTSNPEQCLEPFPENTFSGQIVVCDRGEIARVLKAKNVAAGGAGGFVLANVSGGSTNLADDLFVIPGIHIDADDGDALRSWLASGADHSATITGTDGGVSTNSAAADIVASFSSRGPNLTPESVLSPSLAAPGELILAADLDPVDYGFKSGTSMASPHAAGAGALLVQLHPDWTPAQIHSALTTTGAIDLVKENGTTPADAFDIGGGRIDTPRALDTALFVTETTENFNNADPATGGDPKALNLPSVTDAVCLETCSWSRTVTAGETDSWTVSTTEATGTSITVSPNSFSLATGESQTLDITVSYDALESDGWQFGAVTLTPSSGNSSAIRLPVVTQLSRSNFTGHVDLSSQGSSGDHDFSNIDSITESNLQVSGHLTQASVNSLSLTADTENSSPFDDLSDGVSTRTVSVSANTQALMVELRGASGSVDYDLYVGLDSNANGEAEEFELVASSTTPASDETVYLDLPSSGNYWILVHLWEGSGSVELIRGVVTSTVSSNLSFTAPSSVSSGTAFNIEMSWSDLNPVDTEWFGVVELGNASDADYLGRQTFKISRGSTPDDNDGGNDGNDGGNDSGGGSSGGGALIWITVFLLLRLRFR